VYNAGFDGLVAIDFQVSPYRGTLPDMTANDLDDTIAVPGWLVGRSDGDTILQALSNFSGPQVRLSVKDVHRKPRIGERQLDNFGMRLYITQ